MLNFKDTAISYFAGISCLSCLLPGLCSTISEAHVVSASGKHLTIVGSSYFMEEMSLSELLGSLIK